MYFQSFLVAPKETSRGVFIHFRGGPIEFQWLGKMNVCTSFDWDPDVGKLCFEVLRDLFVRGWQD